MVATSSASTVSTDSASASRSLQTPCKINLHLGIHRQKDARGYHRVDSVMVPVGLFDTVRVEAASELQVIHSPALEVAPQKTTVWKAATLLAEALGVEPNVRVSVEARIPERAGLGGSSADAGAALRLLAELWGVGVDDPRVVDAARRTGADVAFFLDPRPGLYLGAGDELAETFDGFGVPLALVMPNAGGGSTKEAYDEFDRSGVEPVGYETVRKVLLAGDARSMAKALYNNLAPAACALCPEAAEVTEWLAAQPGVLGAQLTGSGTASFALCESVEAADRIAQAALTCGWRAWSTKTLA